MISTLIYQCGCDKPLLYNLFQKKIEAVHVPAWESTPCRGCAVPSSGWRDGTEPGRHRWRWGASASGTWTWWSCIRMRSSSGLKHGKTIQNWLILIGLFGKNYRKIPWYSWEDLWFPVKMFPSTNPLNHQEMETFGWIESLAFGMRSGLPSGFIKHGWLEDPHVFDGWTVYPLVIKHGNGKWTIEIGDFPIETPTWVECPLPCGWLPEGKPSNHQEIGNFRSIASDFWGWNMIRTTAVNPKPTTCNVCSLKSMILPN